jgi:hypothetical protein
MRRRTKSPSYTEPDLVQIRTTDGKVREGQCAAGSVEEAVWDGDDFVALLENDGQVVNIHARHIVWWEARRT